MKTNPKQLTTSQIVILSVLTVAVVLLVVCLFINAVKMTHGQPTPPANELIEETFEPTETTAHTTITPKEPEKTEIHEVTEPSIPEETEPVMLAEMAEFYAQNPEIAGWISIPDTKLNYPVMYTPNDPEKYLHLSFEQTYDLGGVPFLDSDCSLDPESDNLIVYGHNMNNGTQFRTLMSYTDQSFWEEHPVIHYSTLYETRTYEILACFRDRVYYKYEDVFKFYQFIDAKDEDHFNEATAYYKENSLYDTGIHAEYGDHLMTLVTCAYHTENGRFVVIAKQVENTSE